MLWQREIAPDTVCAESYEINATSAQINFDHFTREERENAFPNNRHQIIFQSRTMWKGRKRMKPITAKRWSKTKSKQRKKIDLISSVSFGRGLLLKPERFRSDFFFVLRFITTFRSSSIHSFFQFFNPVDWNEMGKKNDEIFLFALHNACSRVDSRRHMATTNGCDSCRQRRQFQIKTLKTRFECENNERQRGNGEKCASLLVFIRTLISFVLICRKVSKRSQPASYSSSGCWI